MVAAITVDNRVIELLLNPDNTYNILLKKDNVSKMLHAGVYGKNLNAEISVIQENEPRLLQGWRLIVEQE